MKTLCKQILRFAVVGGTAFLIDYGILWILTEIAGLNYLLSNCLSFTASVLFNYIMSVCWVFDVDKTQNKWKEIVVFILLSIIGLGINQAIMWFCVEQLEANYLLIKLLATFIVMVYNFITRKIFLEKKSHTEK